MLPSLALTFLVGLWVGSYVQFIPLLVSLLLALAAAGFVLVERAGRLSVRSGTLLFGAMLAGVVYWPLLQPATERLAPMEIIEAPTTVKGRIVDPVGIGRDRVVLVVAPSASAQPSKIRVTWRAPDIFPRQGDLVEFTSRLHPPSGTQNPGGFDFAAYLAAHDIQAVGSLSGPERLRIVESGLLSWRWFVWTRLDAWRQQLYRVAERSLSPTAVSLYLGFVTGEQGLIEPAVRDQFMATGTVHLLSISGSHLGILAGLTFFLSRVLCQWLPLPVILRLNLWRLTPTRMAALTTAPLVLAYSLLAGAETATLRSLLMILLFLLATWLGRGRSLPPVLAVAALGMLIWDPRVLFDASFQLSYASVLAIALWAKDSGEPESMPSDQGRWGTSVAWVTGALALSLVITGMTIPMVAAHFHQIAWVGPLANVILVPLSAVVVPLSLASGAWALLVQTDGLPLAPVIEWSFHAVLGAVRVCASIPGVEWHVAAPSLATTAVYYGVFLVAMKSGAGQARRIAAVLCLGGLVLWWGWPHRTLPPDTVRVTMLDVGQGDATLIELPTGETILIDAGAAYDRYDVGASVVAPYLWDQGITHITHAIGTHPQLDHVGGWPWLLRRLSVDRFWGAGVVREEAFYQSLLQALAERGLTEVVPERSEIVADGGGCRLTLMGVAHERGTLARGWPARSSASELNNRSLIARLECGPHSFVFVADAEIPRLLELMDQGMAPQTTVVKVPHHGARSSLARPWLAQVHPQVAVVSAGRSNAYHHPHPEVVSAYLEGGASLLRTDRDGAVVVTASPHTSMLTVMTARQLRLQPIVSGPRSASWWDLERQNYRRLCRQAAGGLCQSILTRQSS